MNVYNNNLIKFNQILDAEEIILFEKTTFLVISSTTSIAQQLKQQNRLHLEDDNNIDTTALDPKRFEKISSIIKTYKQSVTKLRTNFHNLVIRGSKGNQFYIDVLTDNMLVMIILKDKEDETSYVNTHEELAVLENIKAARKWFEKIETTK